jgi:hypothetical protein
MPNKFKTMTTSAIRCRDKFGAICKESIQNLSFPSI